MRETSIVNILNYEKQAHERACENNKLEEENDAYRNNFSLEGGSLKDHIRRVGRRIKMIFSRMIHHSIKVLILHLMNNKSRISRSSFGPSHRWKRAPKLVNLVLKNGCADLTDQ